MYMPFTCSIMWSSSLIPILGWVWG